MRDTSECKKSEKKLQDELKAIWCLTFVSGVSPCVEQNVPSRLRQFVRSQKFSLKISYLLTDRIVCLV